MDHELDARDSHRRLIAATVPQLAPGAVVSHGSAALLHGLPVWPDQLAQVHVTRNRAGGGRQRRYVHVHGLPLALGDRVVLDGFVVTSLARTVVDIACCSSFPRAVAVGDAALRRGLTDRVLADQLEGAAAAYGGGHGPASRGVPGPAERECRRI